MPGAIIGGAIIGGLASKKAGDKAAEGARTASAESQRQFDLQRQDALPYIQTGQGALSQLARLYGLPQAQTVTTPGAQAQGTVNIRGVRVPLSSFPQANQPATTQTVMTPGGPPDMSVFFQSPDYQFNLAEGQKAIDRSLAARGKALSGQGVKEGIRYASGMASNEFGNFYNRLANLAGLGQAATGQSAAAGAASAGQMGQAAIAAGNARASAYGGMNQAVQGGIGNILTMKYLGL